jgi:hypothetical protein
MPGTFRRDIFLLLTGKLILLAGLFLACFPPKSRPKVDSSQMANVILCSKEETSDARP